MLVISFGWENFLNSFPKLLWVKAGYCDLFFLVMLLQTVLVCSYSNLRDRCISVLFTFSFFGDSRCVFIKDIIYDAMKNV